jgi:hypothetical protein
LTEPSENALIADVARDALQQVAPQELWRFRAASQAYFDDPDRVVTAGKSEDEMLGFGAEQQITLLTPLVLAMATQVVKFVAEEVAKSLKAESPSVIQQYVRMIFKRVTPTDKVTPTDEMLSTEETPAAVSVPMALTPEQLARVRDIALETARRLNLADDRAELLADSLVGRLVVQPT